METASISSIQDLEGITFRAWPAREVMTFGMWELRFMDGISSRGNSAFTSNTQGERNNEPPPGFEDGTRLEQSIDRVERFYADRKQSPSFHVSPATVPSGLDGALEARGYRVEKPVSVQVTAASQLSAASERAIEVSEALSERWFELAGARSRFAAHQAAYRGLLSRLGTRARFALATLDGIPRATALGVRDGEWFGIHSMLTQPESRRRGLATALLSGLARHAQAEGAMNIYLLVELENTLALELYARAGFREAYRTHYRTKKS